MNPKAFLEAVLRQKSLLVGSTVLCMVISMISFKYVPKSYKVQATVGIQTQYFQIPLVRDFVPETFDGGELRAQREAIVRKAISHEYLRALGKKYSLFGAKTDDEITSFELGELVKRFEIVQVGGGTYLLGFLHRNAETAYNVISDVIDHLRTMLNDDRRSRLISVHDAIQEQLEALTFRKQATSGAIASTRPDLVKQEIDMLRDELGVLRRNYSDKHPKIAELTKRMADLSKFLKPTERTGTATSILHKTFAGAKVDEANKDLFQDLLKKYHYLEVVIDLDVSGKQQYLSVLEEPFVPKAAIWPKRPIFLIWGVAAGFLIGSLLALAAEVIRFRLEAQAEVS